MFGVERKVARVARKGAALTAAGGLAAVGLGLLTVSAWIVMAELRSPEFAALILGLAYLGVAAVAAAFALRKSSASQHASQHVAHEDLSPLQLIVLSFLQGFEQGRQNNRTG